MTTNQLCERVLMDGLDSLVFVMRVEASSGLFIYDFINKKGFDETFLTKDDLGKSLDEVLTAEQSELLHKMYNQVVKEKTIVKYEDSFHSAANRHLINETTLTPLLNDDGVVSEIVAVVRDITDFKLSEAARDESELKMKLSKQRYQSLFDDNSDAICSLSTGGSVTEMNQAFADLSGYREAELVGRSVFDVVEAKVRHQLMRKFFRTLKGNPQRFELRLTNADHNYIDLQVMLTPTIIDDRITGVFAIMKDISEQREAEHTLRKNEEQFRMIAESSHDLITMLDKEGYITYASPSYEYVLGHAPEKYIGQSLLHNLHEHDQESVLEHFRNSQTSGNPFSIEFRQFHMLRGWLWFELQAKPIFQDDGEFYQMVVVTRDITERKAYEEQLKQFAYHDPLTELPNRRLFQDQLSTHLKRNNNNFAVMMMDLDNFKAINDTHGHDVGDEIIKEFGKRIKDTIRDTDFVARLGGDEFILLLTQIDSKERIFDVLHRIQKVVAEPWYVKGLEIKVTSSIGLTMPEETDIIANGNVLIKAADNALYKAKSAGKNTYQLISYRNKVVE
ncbi:sensor domain-containing protein [Halalkalibacillus halophilus]|uniref:sensor domain-containing protein n=1 Tax=Halalkalibacillus halophilus TaxID=392827 RepID=UPI0003F8EE98|nr:diguanylate cyclase [Halalkalibacillus halophilus]